MAPAFARAGRLLRTRRSEMLPYRKNTPQALRDMQDLRGIFHCSFERGCSALDGTDHHTLDEILLNEGVDAHDRHGGQHDGRVLDGLGKLVDLVVLCGCGVQDVGVGNQNSAHDVLDREFLVVFQVDGSEEPCVPVLHAVIQSQNCQRRLDQRNDDPEQNDRVTCPVDVGRLGQGIRHRVDGCPADDGVVNAVVVNYDGNAKTYTLKHGNNYEYYSYWNGSSTSYMQTYFKRVNIPIQTINAIIVSGGGSVQSQYSKDTGEIVKTSEPMSYFVTNELKSWSSGTDVIEYGEEARFANIKGLYIKAKFDSIRKAQKKTEEVMKNNAV